jgi:hypothetical protein
MTQKRLTILSVSWRSAQFLDDLLTHLLALADEPESIRLIVADNTHGSDPDLAALNAPDLQIVPVDVGGEQMSMAHAAGLNALLPRVETPYVLIVDPDVAVFVQGWDRALIAALDAPQIAAAGAPYPGWKLGKYHDFPSPPFALWRTESLKALDPDWRPYARTPGGRLADFARRQLFWLPRLVDRWVLRLPPRQFRVSRWLECGLGVTSKDTGWEIAQRARQRGWQARLFQVAGQADLAAEFQALAREFELYTWNGVPFMTHRNPTRTQISLNLWTRTNVTLYQNRIDKEAQTARWRALVQTLRDSGLCDQG